MSREHWIRQMIDCAYEINIVAEELESKIETGDEVEIDDLVLHLGFKYKEMIEAVEEFKEHYEE
jgi:hypothetical protein